MNILNDLDYCSYPVFHSRTFQRTMSGLTPLAVATLDKDGRSLNLATFSHHISEPPETGGERPRKAVGRMVQFAPMPVEDADQGQLENLAAASDGSWHGFRCRFETGEIDVILLHLPKGTAPARAEGFLSTIWPVLRDDSLSEYRNRHESHGDEALMWLIASKIDIGVLVVNARGLILRANAAAKLMICRNRILMRGHGGIHGISDTQTRILRDAIATCAAADLDESDMIVMLETADCNARVPVTLSRYYHEGQPTDLVTLLLPTPPNPVRVERLAREMGLTMAESRVAAMLQLGLSNREAARSMGLKEQSFSTYAKRVLSKLNVSSRAEMAQMLTWQAHGGRAT